MRNGTQYLVWTRWGRVGDLGQTATVGEGSLNVAMAAFEKKFKDKAGLTWAQRGEAPKAKKYAFVERSYENESDDEVDKPATEKADLPPMKPCTLEPAVQELVKLIFNQSFFNATMKDLNYDAKKLPLGQLSKATINRGFQTLKNLSALIDDASLAPPDVPYATAVAELSDAFYSVIPHYFGRNRPPVINSQALVKREIVTLENLCDMKDASLIMKLDNVDMTVDPLTKQFDGLGMEEMTPLKHESTEFVELKDYLEKTRGGTHDYMTFKNVEEIFRIERQGETARFESSPHASLPSKNRRLLWHGSRTTNFGGILSQGLRIAPPEAPVSGYMFDKGIYLADMSTKSAGYCYPHTSDNTALLLLCEAELGDPVLELLHSNSRAATEVKQKGMISTLGLGADAPTKWKDAGCVHPSLQGTMMVSHSVALGVSLILTFAARCLRETRPHGKAWQLAVQRVHLLRRCPSPSPVSPSRQDSIGFCLDLRRVVDFHGRGTAAYLPTTPLHFRRIYENFRHIWGHFPSHLKAKRWFPRKVVQVRVRVSFSFLFFFCSPSVSHPRTRRRGCGQLNLEGYRAMVLELKGGLNNSAFSVGLNSLICVKQLPWVLR